MLALWPRLRQQLAEGRELVVVTVARVDGSAPREVGASMLVDLEGITGTIGGGHLEWEAQDLALALLRSGGERRLVRLSLAAHLGQCCGGVVWLALEAVRPANLPDWQQGFDQLPLQHRWTRQLGDAHGSHIAAQPDHPSQLVVEGEHWVFDHRIEDARPHLFLFGAGHVGTALVRVLSLANWQISWVDSRDEADGFAHHWPEQVRCLPCEWPEEAVSSAPPGAWFLVMTHRHDLDLLLAEHILRRNDFRFFGMIGSATKKASFKQKLQAKGLDPSRMTCPIGVEGIRSKEPAAIAIAVAAQLLQQYDMAQDLTEPTRLREKQ